MALKQRGDYPHTVCFPSALEQAWRAHQAQHPGATFNGISGQLWECFLQQNEKAAVEEQEVPHA